MYKVKVDDKAVKYLRTLDVKVQRQIVHKLQTLAQNPRPAGYIAIKGVKDLCRIRCGNYRIIYSIRDRELLILVVRIGDRKNVYERLV
jgi:mRNA interferase RelE/StbE